MKKFQFSSPEEMLATINVANVDLYNPTTGQYVFNYNAAGSIAVYDDIDLDDAKQLEKDAREGAEYWAAYLGPGGTIFDDPEYPNFNEDTMTSNLEWCEEHYQEEWIATTDVFAYAEENLKKYYVTFKVEGRYVAEVEATSIEEAREKARVEGYCDADFGELEDIDGEDIIVEDDNDNIIWER